MHDVAKRGLALAVAAGGLLVNGAAPAVSAVGHHPEHPGTAGAGEGRAEAGPGSRVAIPVGTSAAEQQAAHGDAILATVHQSPVPPSPPPPPPPSASSGSLLTDNTVEVPIHAPFNICGVVAAVLGSGHGAVGDSCVNGPDVAGGPRAAVSSHTASGGGLLSDNVVQVPVVVPFNICGDTANVAASNNAVQDILCANQGPGGTSSAASASASNAPGIGSANIVQVPVDIPVNVCGVTATLIGHGNKAAGNSCANGDAPTTPPAPGTPSAGAAANAATADSPGLANGNVVQLPLELPVDVCGDTVNVLGSDNGATANDCVNNGPGGASAKATATGDSGTASGNLLQFPVNAPVEVCGDTVNVSGRKNPAIGNTCANETGGAPTATAFGSTSNGGGIASGAVLQGGGDSPIQVCGEAVGGAASGSAALADTCTNGPTTPPGPALPPPVGPPVLPPPPVGPPVMPVMSPSSFGPRLSPAPQGPPPMTPPLMPPPPQGPPPQAAPPPQATAPRQAPPSPSDPPATTPPAAKPQLPHTGADIIGLAGLGTGALLAGAGAVAISRRKAAARS